MHVFIAHLTHHLTEYKMTLAISLLVFVAVVLAIRAFAKSRQAKPFPTTGSGAAGGDPGRKTDQV